MSASLCVHGIRRTENNEIAVERGEKDRNGTERVRLETAEKLKDGRRKKKRKTKNKKQNVENRHRFLCIGLI